MGGTGPFCWIFGIFQAFGLFGKGGAFRSEQLINFPCDGQQGEGKLICFSPHMGAAQLQGTDFSEAGNLLALNGSIDSLDSFRSILGNDLSFCLDEASGTVLDLRAMWMHEFLNNQAATVASGFGNGVGGTYVLQGTSLGRNFAFLGANLSRVFWDGHARVYGGYDLILNDKQALNTGSGGIKFYC